MLPLNVKVKVLSKERKKKFYAEVDTIYGKKKSFIHEIAEVVHACKGGGSRCGEVK